MANLEYTRSGGVWASDTDLLAAEMADIDGKTVRAMSGDGGAYYFTDDMVWAGDAVTLDISVEMVVRHDITCESDTFLTGPVYVYGQSGFYAASWFYNEVTFEADINANNDTFLNGPTYHYGTTGFYDNVYFEAGSDPLFSAPVVCTSAVTIQGPLIATGVCVLGQPDHLVRVIGQLNVEGVANLQGNVSITGTTNINAPLTMTGTGSIAHRVVAGDDVTTTFSPLAVHEVILDEGVLSGSTDWYIDDTGCVDGNEILFANKDGAAEVGIRRPGGGLLIKLTADWVRCVRRGGVWQLAQKGSF